MGQHDQQSRAVCEEQPEIDTTTALHMFYRALAGSPTLVNRLSPPELQPTVPIEQIRLIIRFFVSSSLLSALTIYRLFLL